jgi:hypothetical protein
MPRSPKGRAARPPPPPRTEPVVVLQRGAMALDQVGQTTKPACVHDLGKVHQHHQPLLPVHQDTTPAALSPFRRQNPREEPGALAAHAGLLRNSILTACSCLQHRLLDASVAKGHVHQIAAALNARGITTPRGGQWYAKSVSNVLAWA